MNKFFKYIILFIVSFVVINIGLKLYKSSKWRNDEVAIQKLIKHCENHTKVKFDKLDKDIKNEAILFIKEGKEFSDSKLPEIEYYKRCISKAIYSYTPLEYFNSKK